MMHFPFQVCIFVQGAHHPPLHPEQPGVAGEKPREIWQEASQIWLRRVSISVHIKNNQNLPSHLQLHRAGGGTQAVEPGPRVGGARQGRRQGDGRPACLVQQLDEQLLEKNNQNFEIFHVLRM